MTRVGPIRDPALRDSLSFYEQLQEAYDRFAIGLVDSMAIDVRRQDIAQVDCIEEFLLLGHEFDVMFVQGSPTLAAETRLNCYLCRP